MADRRKKERKREIPKFEYLQNKKSFLGEIKSSYFIIFHGLSFDEKKETADTSFDVLIWSKKVKKLQKRLKNGKLIMVGSGLIVTDR